MVSVPTFAYAKDGADITPQAVQNSSDNVSKFNIYSSLGINEMPVGEQINVTADKITENSAVLSWDGDGVCLSYTVKQFNVLTEAWDDFAIVNERGIEIKNLSAGTKYRFAVTSTKTSVVLGEVSLETKAAQEPSYKLVNMGLPNVSGKCKTYAYYKAVTVKSSPAYAVLNSGTYKGKKYNTYTDEKTGIRMVDDCYCAALGTFYGTEKGTKYKITLSTGRSFKIILCDTKSNRHTDKNHQYARRNKDIVEFYVERGKIPKNVRGNYNALDQFKGSITKIEKIVYN